MNGDNLIFNFQTKIQIIVDSDINDAVKLFEDGTISGGMIPKVECCIEAIRLGTKKVTILDGRVPHALLIETMTDEGAGTMVVREKKDADEF